MTEVSRMLWTLGSTPIDPRVIGLGADGFPLPPPLTRDSTNGLEIPFYPTFVVSRIDRMKTLNNGDSNDPLSLPNTPLSKIKLAMQTRNQFWPPPICVAKIGNQITRNDPSTTTKPLQQGWVDNDSERSRQPMAPYGILELPIAEGVDLTKQGDFSNDLCAACFYHFAIRPWSVEALLWKKQKVATVGGVFTDKKIILQNIEHQLLTLSERGFPKEHAYLTNVKRLIQWRSGGGSFDNGVIESGVPETRRPVVMPPSASETNSSGFKRNLVYGIPIRALIDVGLMSKDPNECAKILNYLTEQFNLPKAVVVVHKNTNPKKKQASKVRRKTYMDIFFPRITNQQWLSRIKEIPKNMAAPRNMIVSIKDLKNISKGFPEQDRLIIKRLIKKAVKLNPEVNLEIIPFTSNLRSIFLKNQIEAEHMRIKADRGWGQRLMPVFMLPFLLSHNSSCGRIVCGDGTSSAAGLACNFIYSGLVSLINSDQGVLDKKQRSAAWHDSRLLSLSISMAWTSSRQLYLRNTQNSAIYFTNLQSVHQSHKIVMQKLESTDALLYSIQKTQKKILKTLETAKKKKGSKRKRIGSKAVSSKSIKAKKKPLKKKKM